MSAQLIYSPAILKGSLPVGHGYSTGSAASPQNTVPGIAPISKTAMFGSPVDALSRFEFATTSVTKTGGGTHETKKCVKTSERVRIDGRDRVVYRGPRGGRYVRVKGAMVSVSTAAKR